MANKLVVNEGCLYKETLQSFVEHKLKLNPEPPPTLWHKRVPYEFEEKFPESTAKEVKKAIETFNNTARVNSINLIFEPKHDRDIDYVCFKYDQNKSRSTIGRRQAGEITIAEWAEERDILHEFMHTLGFLHEHQRIDSLISVDYDIKSYYQANTPEVRDFIKHNITTPLGVPVTPYDKESILHYPTIFTFNGIRFELKVYNKISDKNETIAIDRVPNDGDEVHQFLRNNNVLERINMELPILFSSYDACESFLKEESKPRNRENSLFSKWDIYLMQIFYGNAECNYKLYREPFIQAHFACQKCKQRVCISCGFNHHKEHKLESIIPDSNLNSIGYTLACECGKNGCSKH